MKPITIELQAFGPYSGYEKVDFESLSSKGLFLICGKTGSGKTMILDAMTFALFGRSSTSARDDFESLRCTKADFDTSTFVKFTFSSNNEFYIFERRLDRKRKNLSPSYSVLKLDDDGVYRPLFENAKEKALNEKAVSILGLEYEQFRQVIVLPQGQFERFLTSGSDEKEKILTSIFGEEKWKLFAEKFYEKASARREELKEQKNKVMFSLLEEKCETIDNLSQIIEEKSLALKTLESEYEAKGYEEISKKLQEKLALIKRFDAAKENCKVRKEAYERAKNEAAVAQKAYEDILEKCREYAEQESEISKKNERKIELESKRNVYEEIEKVREKQDEAKKEEKNLKSLEESLSMDFTKLSAETAGIKSNYDEYTSEHLRLMDVYIAGITGELASTLTEGKPCPVCGSTTHPKKAVTADDSVSKETVNAAKDKAEREFEKLRQITAKQEEAKQNLDNAHKNTEAKHEEVAALTAKLEGMTNSFVEGIDSLAGLNSEVLKLGREINEYSEKKELLEKRKDELLRQRTECSSKENLAKSEMENAKEKFEEMLAEQGDEEMLAEHVILQRMDEIKIQRSEYDKKHGMMSNDIVRLSEKRDRLSNACFGLEEKMKQAEEDFVFAKKLRGDTGTGLQRYVLGVMFSQVVASANKMLELACDGRYRLYRSDDKNTGNKRGLELKVFDKNSENHEGRFVSTLSGGEKFLTSLALSIGMSNVASKSGIKIEALFIDEGFGSLDEDSICDAMDILNSIQKANGIVGIISHVGILQDRIGAKLIIEEDETGSHIIESIG